MKECSTMYHQHFDQIPSTQTYLKDHLSELEKIEQDILITCNQQTEGHGRNNKTWNDSEGSVAFSFTFHANHSPTIIPLFVAMEIVTFIKSEFHTTLAVKWPNDLYYLNKKCGGIICHKIDQTIIVGVGLNLSSSPKNLTDENNQIAHLNLNLPHDFKKSLPLKIYESILKSTFDENKIINSFNQSGLYLNEQVTISEDGQMTTGKLLGIGTIGEAIIQNDNGEIQKLYNGTLRKKD